MLLGVSNIRLLQDVGVTLTMDQIEAGLCANCKDGVLNSK